MPEQASFGPEQQFHVPVKLRTREARTATEALLRLSDNDAVLLVQALAEHVCHIQRYKSGNAEALLRKVIVRSKHETAALKLNKQISGSVKGEYWKQTEESEHKRRPKTPPPTIYEGRPGSAGILERPMLARLPSKLRDRKPPRSPAKDAYAKRIYGKYKMYGIRGAPQDLLRAQHSLPAVGAEEGEGEGGGGRPPRPQSAGDALHGGMGSRRGNFPAEGPISGDWGQRPATAAPGGRGGGAGANPSPQKSKSTSQVGLSPTGNRRASPPRPGTANPRPRSTSPHRPGTAPPGRREPEPELTEEEKAALQKEKDEAHKQWLSDRSKRKDLNRESARARARKDRRWIDDLITSQNRRKKQREESDRLNAAARCIQTRWRKKRAIELAHLEQEQKRMQEGKMHKLETLKSMRVMINQNPLQGIRELTAMKREQKESGNVNEEELLSDDLRRLFGKSSQ